VDPGSKKPKKLTLKKQPLRSIDDEELKEAAGGTPFWVVSIVFTTVFTSCPTCSHNACQ
jgi:hypothetical protein